MIKVRDYPKLSFISWDTPGQAEMTPQEVWERYAYRWEYMCLGGDITALEKDLINGLIAEFGAIIPVEQIRGTMGKWIYGEAIYEV